MNFNLINKEIPLQTFLLTGNIKNDILIKNLLNFVKENFNAELKNTTHVIGNFTGFYGLINCLFFKDFLTEIKKEIQIIFHAERFFLSSAWGNILLKNDEVTNHNHAATSAFCGILYLTEGGPGTYFSEYDLTVEEKIGKFILFHPYLYHSVKKIDKDIERVTIAFNATKALPWDNKTDNKLVI